MRDIVIGRLQKSPPANFETYEDCLRVARWFSNLSHPEAPDRNGFILVAKGSPDDRPHGLWHRIDGRETFKKK